MRNPSSRVPTRLPGTLCTLILPLTLLDFSSSNAVAQKPPAVTAAAGSAGVYGEKDLTPLDAVNAVVEDQLILESQIQDQLQLMRAMAGPNQPVAKTDQAYRTLLEGRLIAWDADRKHLQNQDSDVDRMIDAWAAKQGFKTGREFLAEAQKHGIEERMYRTYVRQALLEARWESLYRSSNAGPAKQPPPTRAQGVAALEAEAIIDRPQGLFERRPAAQRTCLPSNLPAPPAARPTKEQEVAAVCIEGASGPDTAAQLATLQRVVPLQTPLSRDVVARSLIELCDSRGGPEAAVVYSLPLRPGGDSRGPLLVVYRLQPRPLLSGVELQGIPQGVVVPAITIAPNTRYSHRELHDQLSSTLSSLEDVGYLRATAKAERLPRRNDSEPLRVRFDVTAGSRTYIAQLALPGIAAARLSEITALTALRAGEPLSESKLVAGREKIGAYYLERGFLKAHVAPHTTEAAAARADGSPQVTVRMVVTEGKQYRLGTIKMAGALPLPEAELQKFVKTRRGEVLRIDAMRNDLNSMMEAGKRAGKSVSIDPVTSLNDATATIDFTLNFTPQTP